MGTYNMRVTHDVFDATFIIFCPRVQNAKYEMYIRITINPRKYLLATISSQIENYRHMNTIYSITCH